MIGPDGRYRPAKSAFGVEGGGDAPLGDQRRQPVVLTVVDLFGFAAARLSEIQRKANVHFKPNGSAALADEVVRAVAPHVTSK